MQVMLKGKDVRDAFGLAVKELRAAKGISQEKLAELADLDRSYISEIERGIKSASVITIFKIANALDIKPTHLIQETENKDALGKN